MVAVKNIGTIIGHVQIAVPVAVDVAHGAAHAPTAIPNASKQGHIGKGAVALVAVEYIARAGFLSIGIDRSAVDRV